MKLVKGLPIAIAIALLSGCMNTNTGVDTKNLKQHNAGPVRVQSDHQGPGGNNKGSIRMHSQSGRTGEPNFKVAENINQGSQHVSIKQINNTPYVSLAGLTQATGYYGEWVEDNTFGMGDTDPMWTFKTGDSTALVEGNLIKMPAPAVKEGTELYIPVSAMQKLFGEVTVFSIDSNNISFFPKSTQEETGADGKSLDFADDTDIQPNTHSTLSIKASSNFDSTKLINYAKGYLGVKYDFGALPYNSSKRFDCSTFTQHVFKRYDVNLPRLSRQQANEGKYIARNKLSTGDLLFFYVPGRFKTNNTVGHVAIYMGSGKMIHSSPKPIDGVQITSINKEYWKETFLYARRVR